MTAYFSLSFDTFQIRMAMATGVLSTNHHPIGSLDLGYHVRWLARASRSALSSRFVSRFYLHVISDFLLFGQSLDIFPVSLDNCRLNRVIFA